MTFWGGSGSADPCLLLMDPDPSIFVTDLQDTSKKLTFNTIFSAYDFLKLHLHHFSKIKIQKESQNSRNQGFSFYFCMIIEGSGSIPLTSGSGSGSWRPKNTVDPVDPDPQHCCRLLRLRSAVKWGNVVTLFAKNHIFFLRILFRWPNIICFYKIQFKKVSDVGMVIFGFCQHLDP